MKTSLRIAFWLSSRFARLYEGKSPDPVVRAYATLAQKGLPILDLARAIVRDCLNLGWQLNHRAIAVYNDHFGDLPLSKDESDRLKAAIRSELRNWGARDPELVIRSLLNNLHIYSEDELL